MAKDSDNFGLVALIGGLIVGLGSLVIAGAKALGAVNEIKRTQKSTKEAKQYVDF
jgi:hypothetical protein